MIYLLDTNVISEPRRKKPDANVIRWLRNVNFQNTFLSVVTVGEIKKGAVKLESGRQRIEIEDWIEKMRGKFASRILPITEKTFLVWGRMFGTSGVVLFVQH